MSPLLHFVRHAQGFHNLKPENSSMHDPLLTDKGLEQCAQLQNNFPYHEGIELLVSSPIKRTVYTSLLSFKKDIERKHLTVLCMPELQETTSLPCDTGSEPQELAEAFANEPVNFDLVTPGWNVKKGKWGPEAEAISKRAHYAREWLKKRPEKEIVVVTHGGFLHYLSGDWDHKDKFSGTGWANTEFRSYRFDPLRPETAEIIETDFSLQRRGIKPLDHNELTQLEHTVSREAAEKAAKESKEVADKANKSSPHTPTDVPQPKPDDTPTRKPDEASARKPNDTPTRKPDDAPTRKPEESAARKPDVAIPCNTEEMRPRSSSTVIAAK